MPPDKLRAYLPGNASGLNIRQPKSEDSITDDFAIVYTDAQTRKGQIFHYSIKDEADDEYGKNFPNQVDKRATKITYKGRPGRNRITDMARGRPGGRNTRETVEVMVGTRFLVTVCEDQDERHSPQSDPVDRALDYMDLEALEHLTPPRVMTPKDTGSAPAANIPRFSNVPTHATARPTPTPQPLASPGEVLTVDEPVKRGIDKTALDNELTRKIEKRLTGILEQERREAEDIVRTEDALSTAPLTSKTGLLSSLTQHRLKLSELKKQYQDARRDLVREQHRPPPPVVTPKPTPTPSIRERWTAQVDPLMKDSTKAHQVIDIIQALPVEERQTPQYHVILAKSLHALLLQDAAADALLTLSLITSEPHPELDPIRNWLKKRADQEYKVAMAGRKIGDGKAAIKHYLHAVKLDSTTLSRDDQGLRTSSQKALQTAVEKHAERTDYLFLLGLFTYYAGDPTTAQQCFQKFVQLEKDPYLIWRGKIWTAKVEKELQAK
jgi:tetratricopeptide (TPR) repeat protein